MSPQVVLSGLTFDVPDELGPGMAAELAAGTYEGLEASLAGVAFERGDIVLDAGAGIGYLAVLLARKGCHVVSYEPHPELYHVARINLDRLAPGASLYNAALDRAGKPPRRSAILACAADPWASRLDPGGATGAPGRVRVMARIASDEIALHGATGLCLDVEGHEAILLREGAIDLGRIRTLLVEWHPDVADSVPSQQWLAGSGFSRVATCTKEPYTPVVEWWERR